MKTTEKLNGLGRLPAGGAIKTPVGAPLARASDEVRQLLATQNGTGEVDAFRTRLTQARALASEAPSPTGREALRALTEALESEVRAPARRAPPPVSSLQQESLDFVAGRALGGGLGEVRDRLLALGLNGDITQDQLKNFNEIVTSLQGLYFSLGMNLDMRVGDLAPGARVDGAAFGIGAGHSAYLGPEAQLPLVSLTPGQRPSPSASLGTTTTDGGIDWG